MLDIDTISDPAQLRAVCRAYESSHRILTKRLEELAQQIAELQGLDAAQAALDLPDVEVEIGEPAAAPTAASSQADEPTVDAPKTPRRGHGPAAQPRLPVEIQEQRLTPLPECPSCQGEMALWEGQYEESEEITVVETGFCVRLIRRQKYRCRCNGAVLTAPGPPKLIPGGRYSLDFAIHSAMSKFCDHLPLERQVRMAARQGLEITSQTLWDQQAALAAHLEPVWQRLCEQVLLEDVLHVDETGWRMMAAKDNPKWTLFGLTSPRLAVYRLVRSKSTAMARKILSGFEGTLVVDGYVVYPLVAKLEEGPIRIAHCWAHADRKFRDAKDPPQAISEIRKLIHRLYEIEREVPGPFPGDEAAQRRRLELRERESRPAVDALRDLAFEQGGLRRSDFGKALRYMLKHWDGLTLFLGNPRIPLDNNAAERVLRGPVVGRKNFYGNRSARGARVAAILYSLIETAKLNGQDPADYLRRAATAAIAQPGSIVLPG